mgnify:CR=1 FL=1
MLYTTALLEVRARLQELTPDFWLDNELYRAINEGIQRFAQEEKWPYLYTVATGIAVDTTTEVQTMTVTGGPSGGTFTVGFGSAISGTIAFNAAAATVQTTLQAMGSIGLNNITVSGGAGGPWTLTFAGSLVRSDQPLFTLVTNSLTGGTNPSVAFAETTKGGVTTVPLQTGVAFERHFNLLMTFTGEQRPRAPRRVHPGEGYNLRMTYYTPTSEPLAYYIASEANAAGVYTSTIRFVPPLSRAATLEYQYVRDPVVVAAPTTEALDVPEEYAMGVCSYAAGHAFLKELNFSKKSDEQFALYAKAVADAKREARKVMPDSGLVWGAQQPQYGWVDPALEAYYSVPDLLGP